MKKLSIALGLLLFSSSLLAVETMTPAASITRMLVGLAIVLLVMAVIAWAMKKTMQGKFGKQNHIRIVDGVSVGTRERVVVLAVADRWLVVGVAAGQVTQLANLPAGVERTAADADQPNEPAQTPDAQAFSTVLAAATQQAKSTS